MKRGWNPLDVGGLRLYKVTRYFHYREGAVKHDDLLVLARKPRIAEEVIMKIYKDTEWHPDILNVTFTTSPANVLMPKSWWEKGVPCEQSETG